MYRLGTTTPSAQQIQQIVAKLRTFGQIQGKNIFYWFQNHKARERQKIRRQLQLRHATHTPQPKHTGLGLSRRYFGNEPQMRKLPTPSSNCCTTPSEGAEYQKDGWTGLDEKKNETSCWHLDLSSCLPLPPNNSIQTFTAHKPSAQKKSKPYGALNLSILLPPKIDDMNPGPGLIDDENQTLQLFPIKSNDLRTFDAHATTKEDLHGVSRLVTKFTPNEFIEFLPTKN